ncbi:MAG: hypothetical protein U1F25_11685 [Rubrivivax sp.]
MEVAESGRQRRDAPFRAALAHGSRRRGRHPVKVAGRPTLPREVVLPRSFNGQVQGYARIELPVADGVNPLSVEIIANRYGHSEPLAFIIERELPPPPPGGWPKLLRAGHRRGRVRAAGVPPGPGREGRGRLRRGDEAPGRAAVPARRRQDAHQRRGQRRPRCCASSTGCARA